jgi:hypothetical protein
LEKNSFVLVETILSLIIVSTILGGFYTLLNTTNDFKTYNVLQKAQNDFTNNKLKISSYDGIKFYIK